MISIFTENYTVRTMTRELVSDEWRRWAADRALMRTINSAPMTVSLVELRSYVSAFDNKQRHLLGIFTREDMKHLGIYELDLHLFHRTVNVQVLIGSGPVARVRAETDPALLDYLFGTGGAEKVVALVPAYESRQAKQLRQLGFAEEGRLREERRIAGTEERTDYLQFGLLKEDWG